MISIYIGIFPGQEIYLWAQQFGTFYQWRAWQALKRNIKPFKDSISVFNFFSPVPFLAFQASTPNLAIPFASLFFWCQSLSAKKLCQKTLKGPQPCQPNVSHEWAGVFESLCGPLVAVHCHPGRPGFSMMQSLHFSAPVLWFLAIEMLQSSIPSRTFPLAGCANSGKSVFCLLEAKEYPKAGGIPWYLLKMNDLRVICPALLMFGPHASKCHPTAFDSECRSAGVPMEDPLPPQSLT